MTDECKQHKIRDVKCHNCWESFGKQEERQRILKIIDNWHSKMKYILNKSYIKDLKQKIEANEE